MTNDMKKRFLADRARALATVYLTRRKDLTVAETEAGAGLDFHVYIGRKRDPMRPVFGVVSHGALEPVTAGHANKVLRPTLSWFQRAGGFTYPVVLLFFTMREEQAFFAWLAEPVLDDSGAPKLLHHTKVDCQPLTDGLLGKAVDRVVKWYGALQAALVAQDGAARS
jgi:hypothetical protein